MNRTAILAAAAATVGTLAIAPAQQRWDWSGGRPGGVDYRLAGPGARLLFPELRGSARGRAFVMRNFDRDRNGLITPPEADEANRVFARLAGPRRDRFDWDARDAGFRQPRWDRRAMRDYRFRQTPRGATMTMQEDVLFATDSAVLRADAVDRLRPLAGYLAGNPGVRVAIDGYTDSRGTDAHNQSLSERRAESVRAALIGLGVTRARFIVAGHGEADPVAPNSTADGMRRNRRVEVTLLGQRADAFAMPE